MRKTYRIIISFMLLLLFISCTFLFTGCGKKDSDESLPNGYKKNTELDANEQIKLRIVGSNTVWSQLDMVIAEFNKIYPNCEIVYDFIDNYTKALPIRLSQPESDVDIFCTVNIQKGSDLEEFALNLISDDAKKMLDLSRCNEGIVNNFKYTAASNIQYAVPFSGLMRGMFVNKTLLNLCGLSTPTNRSEFLNCCKVLVEKGYIAVQCPPENLGQQMLYPSMCNKIANADDYQTTWNSVQNCDDNISELFKDEYELFYDMIRNGYINFSSVAKGKALLNLEKQSDGSYKKIDDIGKIGFVVDTQSMSISLDKDIKDYHSTIEYEFIASPTGEDGGYAYLSPSDGFAVCKNSKHIEWSLEFLNYFFSPEVNTNFSKNSGLIPNTKESMLEFNISPERMCTVGEVTFDYGAAPNFYNTVTMLTRNGYAYSNSGFFVETYASVNENYRSVFTEETYYRKLTTPRYDVADNNFITTNPNSVYRLELETYSIAGAAYVTDHPSETYYRKVTHEAIDNEYIIENPEEKIYRYVTPMEGMPFMIVKNADGSFVKKADGTYEVMYTLDEYLDRLEKEFQIAKAYKYGIAELE